MLTEEHGPFKSKVFDDVLHIFWEARRLKPRCAPHNHKWAELWWVVATKCKQEVALPNNEALLSFLKGWCSKYPPKSAGTP